MEKFYTKQETADILKVKYRTIERYIASGKLTANKSKGGKVYIYESAINEFVKNNDEQKEVNA